MSTTTLTGPGSSSGSPGTTTYNNHNHGLESSVSSNNSNHGTNTIKRCKLDEDAVNRNHQEWSIGDTGTGALSMSGSLVKRKKDEPERLNHILLFTILNPMYPITTDVLHTICSTHGQVLRIVVFKKHGVQAMVEFDGIDSAKRAKEALHGADIYSGCCTIKIDFAKPSKLNVYKNDTESWDYTNPNLGNHKEGRAGPLLQEPRFGTAPIPYRSNGADPPGRSTSSSYDRYENGYCPTSRSANNGSSSGCPGAGSVGVGSSYHHHESPPFGDRYGVPCPERYDLTGIPGKDDYTYGGSISRNGAPHLRASPPADLVPLSPSNGAGGSVGNPALAGGISNSRPMQQGAVMMVYGLSLSRVNPDKLFNLFCLYGNVVRVKFLKSKEGCAMVQMGDGVSVDRTMSNFNNTFMFGSKVQLGYSKQAFLSDVQQPHILPDGSPSFKDFMGNKNNRFLNPEMASKNRIQPPTKILHFFNTPPTMTENELKEVFLEAEAPIAKTVKLFQSKSERSSSGLLEFEKLSDAVEALCIMNHYPIKSAGGKFPFIMKLCFSSSRNPQNRTITEDF